MSGRDAEEGNGSESGTWGIQAEYELAFSKEKILFSPHTPTAPSEESLSQLTHREPLCSLLSRCGESPRRYRACPHLNPRKATDSKHVGTGMEEARIFYALPSPTPFTGMVSRVAFVLGHSVAPLPTHPFAQGRGTREDTSAPDCSSGCAQLAWADSCS
jgi:hypothetical protein